MTKNKYSRVKKLEDEAGIQSDRRHVLPMCCYYMGSDVKTCSCKPYYTRKPFVILSDMNEFYRQANSGKCQPIPDDAEFIEEAV